MRNVKKPGRSADSFGARRSARSGRFEPSALQRSGRSRGSTVTYQHGCRRPLASLTFRAAPTAKLNFGLRALTERTPDDGDRQQPLRSGHLQRPPEGSYAGVQCGRVQTQIGLDAPCQNDSRLIPTHRSSPSCDRAGGATTLPFSGNAAKRVCSDRAPCRTMVGTPSCSSRCTNEDH